MTQDWNSYRTEVHSKLRAFAKASPETMRALAALETAAVKTGHLDKKVHELIALAVAVTTRCDGCLATHAKRAAEQGASREEIAEALSVAIAMNAGAALVYAGRALEAFDTLHDSDPDRSAG